MADDKKGACELGREGHVAKVARPLWNARFGKIRCRSPSGRKPWPKTQRTPSGRVRAEPTPRNSSASATGRLTVCAADFLPFLDLVAARFLVRGEFTNRRMRTVFGGLVHGAGPPNLSPRGKFRVTRNNGPPPTSDHRAQNAVDDAICNVEDAQSTIHPAQNSVDGAICNVEDAQSILDLTFH